MLKEQLDQAKIDEKDLQKLNEIKNSVSTEHKQTRWIDQVQKNKNSELESELGK